MERYSGGHVWSEVRSSLSRHRERLIAAFDAKSFEQESILLDAIARQITENIEPMIESYAEARLKRPKADEVSAARHKRS